MCINFEKKILGEYSWTTVFGDSVPDLWTGREGKGRCWKRRNGEVRRGERCKRREGHILAPVWQNAVYSTGLTD